MRNANHPPSSVDMKAAMPTRINVIEYQDRMNENVSTADEEKVRHNRAAPAIAH
jgi:hypothetical protein